jgi:hypothetical protein
VANSRFKQLRVFWEVHFCVPQNFLSLTENNQFRTSQLREAANVVGNFGNEKPNIKLNKSND